MDKKTQFNVWYVMVALAGGMLGMEGSAESAIALYEQSSADQNRTADRLLAMSLCL